MPTLNLETLLQNPYSYAAQQYFAELSENEAMLADQFLAYEISVVEHYLDETKKEEELDEKAREVYEEQAKIFEQSIRSYNAAERERAKQNIEALQNDLHSNNKYVITKDIAVLREQLQQQQASYATHLRNALSQPFTLPNGTQLKLPNDALYQVSTSVLDTIEDRFKNAPSPDEQRQKMLKMDPDHPRFQQERLLIENASPEDKPKVIHALAENNEKRTEFVDGAFLAANLRNDIIDQLHNALKQTKKSGYDLAEELTKFAKDHGFNQLMQLVQHVVSHIQKADKPQKETRIQIDEKGLLLDYGSSPAEKLTILKNR